MRSNFEPSYGLSGTKRTTPPGTEARWYASCPADMDFSCGFQVNRSSGKRSRNLRVIGACASNSANIDSASNIAILLILLKLEPSSFHYFSRARSATDEFIALRPFPRVLLPLAPLRAH